MPLKDCVKFGGKIYYYNSDSGDITVYDSKRIKCSECPDRVLNALFNLKTHGTVELDDIEEDSKPLKGK